MRRATVAIFTILLTACGGGPALPSVTTEVTTPEDEARTAGWAADLDQLVTARERYHPEPWHGIDRGGYVAAVEAVKARVPELDDDELMVEVMRLAAMPTLAGRDGHGGIHPWAEGRAEVNLYPLRLYQFSDGLYVTDALAPHEDLVGTQVTHVNGRPALEVMAAIAPLIPRDNHQQVVSQAPLLLLAAEVLDGLGVIEDAGAPVPFTFGRAGEVTTVEVEPIPRDEYLDWAGGFGIWIPPARPDGPAWIRQPSTEIWWEPIPDGAAAYIQYNFTTSPGDVPAQVADAIDAGSVDRVIVDVRNNPGGNNGTYDELLDLLTSPKLAGEGRIYVIIGRTTFSAAGNFITEVEHETDAIFVGEDSGSSPNQFGDAVTVRLDHSGLILRVAPEFVVPSDPADTRITIEPDIDAPLSSADYFGDRDPAMEAILADL
jgi:hypothetical protein